MTAVAGIVASAALLACAGPAPQERLRVVVTVLPLAGLVDRVAPDLADIVVMIPSGANPVTHEPTLSHLRDAAAADLVFGIGHPALTWETTWLGELANPDARSVVMVARDCRTMAGDPHVWLSISCARLMADTIAATLQSALPAATDSIRRSLTAFHAEVEAVSAEARGRLAGHEGSAFLTLHPAWGYLAREHGLEQLAILEHGSGDAGPGGLARVIERARRKGLSNVIVQPQFSGGPAQLVADELGGVLLSLDPLRREWSAGLREAVQVIGNEVAR